MIQVVLGFLIAMGLGGANNADSVRRSLESRYQHARTLKAVFFERYTDGNGTVAAESGTVYFSRPGRMRWEYESPEQKLFLVDGTNVWLYVPADRTASRAKLKESSDWRTPIALLAGKADLSRLCRRLEVVNAGDAASPPADNPRSPADVVLRCIPREEPASAPGSIREVLFEVDPQSYLARVVIRQPGDAATEFRFGAWQENLPIPEVSFHFSPPPGVSVVDAASLSEASR
jgi:outer membrane lipoprotein carrier protein